VAGRAGVQCGGGVDQCRLTCHVEQRGGGGPPFFFTRMAPPKHWRQDAKGFWPSVAEKTIWRFLSAPREGGGWRERSSTARPCRRPGESKGFTRFTLEHGGVHRSGYRIGQTVHGNGSLPVERSRPILDKDRARD